MIILAFLTGLHAQDEFEKFLKKEQQNFAEYVNKQDQAFSNFLKKRWERVDLKKPPKDYKRPKPTTLPVLEKPKPVKKEAVKEVPKVVVKEEPPIKTPEPKPIETVAPERVRNTLTFYGLKLPASELDRPSIRLNAISNQTIAAFFSDFSNYEKDKLTKLVAETRQKFNLSDYETIDYTYMLSSTLFNDQRMIRLSMWYLLTKNGYQAKIGYNQSQLMLLLPVREMLYSVTYFNFPREKQRYYAFTPQRIPEKVSGAIYTYKGNYPDATKPFQFDTGRYPTIGVTRTPKTFTFNYNGKPYTIQLAFNKAAVDFYKYFPQTELAIYLKTPIQQQTAKAMIDQFKPLIDGMTEAEAANFLIRFVQTAFEYQTDQQQFNREKYLFPEETLYYAYSDCEDRSILYAYLIKNLLGLEVVGLKYPGHVATAVRFSASVDGDTVSANGKTYLVCDPTYVNANIGMAMPQFKTVKPEIIAY